MSAACLRIEAFEHRFAGGRVPVDPGFHADWEAEIDTWWALAEELSEAGGDCDAAPAMAGLVFTSTRDSFGARSFPVV